MQTEIIIIGNELISGKTRDLNGWYASGCLLSHGLEVSEIRTVGDNYNTLSSVLKAAIKRSNFIIITGGLGPTEDDLTTEIVSKALDRPLLLDQTVLNHIKEYTKKFGLTWSPSLEKLAWLPRGAKILDPKREMCGFSLSEGDSLLYFLPGVPEQMRELMNRAVIPDILRRYRPATVPQHRILKVYGLSESRISDVFKGLSNELKRVMFGFYPSFPENHITITVRGKEDAEIESELNRAEKKINNLLGPYIFASGDKTMESIVGELLKERKMMVSVAESCTGGLIGHRLTTISGSSLYFERGLIVYSNRSKVEMLGVMQQTIDSYGAVSDQTVREMAEGVKKIAKTDLGLAVTGIAGPLGESEDKPVGTVFIGLSVDGKIFSAQYRFSGDRDKVKLNTSEMALDWVRRYLNGYPFIPGI
ncbi:MAG: CinA family nicotinamide mononucleotide deamidase-related protein [Desulfobacteraceae bacterium]|nr:MAG: CinA family nicotinamide mononucleotide deamidase-related protein [Desulfobacteraceae bacterium]